MSQAKAKNGAVDKACRLLKEAASRGAFGLSEIARALDEPTSTVDRLIKTLAEHNILERRGELWRLGPFARAMWAEGTRALRRERQEIDGELKRISLEED